MHVTVFSASPELEMDCLSSMSSASYEQIPPFRQAHGRTVVLRVEVVPAVVVIGVVVIVGEAVGVGWTITELARGLLALLEDM